ncbi:MAG: Bax inhibitor-1/YccA family protein [Acidobacteriota bacterium]
MSDRLSQPSSWQPAQGAHAAVALPSEARWASTQKVLRNTYGLLGLTIAFSAAVAATSMAMGWPAPGMLVSLLGMLGLFFLTHKLANSGWGLVSTFGLTGFMGYALGPVLNQVMALPAGAAIVTNALAATAAAFLGMSAIAWTSKRDFSFMGSYLLMGMLVAVVLGLGAMWLQIPVLSLAVSAMVVLLMCGMLLFETSRIVHGGETNYILATVSLYTSIYNLFTSLLTLFGFGGSDE